MYCHNMALLNYWTGWSFACVLIPNGGTQDVVPFQSILVVIPTFWSTHFRLISIYQKHINCAKNVTTTHFQTLPTAGITNSQRCARPTSAYTFCSGAWYAWFWHTRHFKSFALSKKRRNIQGRVDEHNEHLEKIFWNHEVVKRRVRWECDGDTRACDGVSMFPDAVPWWFHCGFWQPDSISAENSYLAIKTSEMVSCITYSASQNGVESNLFSVSSKNLQFWHAPSIQSQFVLFWVFFPHETTKPNTEKNKCQMRVYAFRYQTQWDILLLRLRDRDVFATERSSGGGSADLED